MFTKIGEYLKPILGRRDHVPLDPVRSIDPNDHHVRGKEAVKKRHKKQKADDAEDTMLLSLGALEAMLEAEMLEDIDLYAEVQHLMAEFRKKKVTHISVLQHEKLIHALRRAAAKYGIEKSA